MKRLLTISIILAFSTGIGYAADSVSHAVTLQVNEVCLINLNSTATVTLSTVAPSTGGQVPTGNTDASKLLQYTSLVPSGGSRNITVSWGVTDAAPAGTSLLLEATNVPADCGTAGAPITLSRDAQVIITDIGSCATGVGSGSAVLRYSFEIDDVNSLVVGDTKTVTVNFTLTDAS